MTCLASAVWQKGLEFLKGADCISFTRDESHGRLIVRYSAGNADLSMRSGLFGQSRFAGSTSQNIADATAVMIQRMATERGAASFNKEVYDAIRLKIEMLSVDSASNEVLAANIMRRPEQRRADEELLTPNLKVLVRDKAHGMRRRDRTTIQIDP